MPTLTDREIRDEILADARAKMASNTSNTFGYTGGNSAINSKAKSISDVGPANFSTTIQGLLDQAAANSPSSQVLPTLAVSSLANRNNLNDAGITRVRRNDLRDLNEQTAGKYGLVGDVNALPTNAVADALRDPLMMGAGLGRATDALYSGIGGGIDAALDTVIGDGLIGGVFGNDIAADKFKNFLTGDSLGAIADIGTDIALLGLTGGTALPFVAAKALARNSQPIYDAINGIDSVTGQQLDTGQRIAKGGLAGLDLVLSSLPAGGVFKGAAKGMRNATKAAEEGAKADALKAIENAAKAENRPNAVKDLTEEQLANTEKYLKDHGIKVAEPDSVEKVESRRSNIASALEDLAKDNEAMKGLSKDARRAETAQKYNSMEENSVGNLIRNLRDNDWRANRQTVARADLPFVNGFSIDLPLVGKVGKNRYVPTPEEQNAIVTLNEFKEMKAAELAEAGAKPKVIKAAEKEIDKEIKQIESGSYARAAERESAKGASGLPDANELNRQMEALKDFVEENNLSLSKPAALRKALKDDGAPKVDDVIKMLFPEKESVGIARRLANTAAAGISPGLAAYAQGDYDGLNSLTDYYANAITHPGDLALTLARPGMRMFNNRFGLQTARNSLPTEALLSANLGMRSGAMGGGTMSTASPYDTDSTPEAQYEAMIKYLTTNDRPTVGLPY